MATENLNRPERAERDFDLKSLFFRYLKYWFWFPLSLVLALAVAKYYNWYKNPIYAVTAKLLVKDENVAKDQFLKQLDVESPSKNLENEIEILRSHSLLAKTLNELEFDVSYYLIGDLKVSEAYKDSPFIVDASSLNFAAYGHFFEVFIVDSSSFEFSYSQGEEEVTKKQKFGEAFDFELGRIKVDKRENFSNQDLQNPNYDKRNYRILFNTISSNQNRYLSKLSVALARSQSTILQLYLEDEVPQKGLDFLNALIKVYLENDVDLKNKAASRTAEFLDDQLEGITDDLENIEVNREKYKASKGIIDLKSESQIVLESIKELDSKGAINTTKLGLIRQLRDYVTENVDMRDLAPAALDITDPLLVKLINKLSELQSQREYIINNATVNDPRLFSLNAEIELTRSSLLENIKNIEKGLVQQQSEIEESQNSFRNRIQRIPTTERELLEIERKFRIQESLYLFLLEKRAELAISLAATESDTRVVDAARVIPGPISPVPQRAYSIAVLLGIFVPLLIIFFIENLNDKVTDIATLKRLTNIPVVGMVRFNEYNSPLVVLEKPRSSISEEYRSIRTNLNFFDSDGSAEVVMVTSSIGTEGKTFTAMNLASIMAAAGSKVVLIGLDLRKPRIVEDFQIDNSTGCSNYLSGHAQLDDILIPSGYTDNLFIAPSGPPPPNPSELINSDRMPRLIKELSQRFDKIVIDTPPVGLVSDGLQITEYANTTIFVVREGVTRKAHLIQANEMFEKERLMHPAIVFNAVQRKNKSYAYGGAYGYGYGYGYQTDYGNYFDEKKDANKSKWNPFKNNA
ncbi:MAG: polysaccharide biosynthesis tyrosine autokinase [Flavobacteriales bacterium]|nr:polysaccharide biosynthesis tyrosine autokinase [Flavobacteriales bacterium]